jgi:hypothetical protein
MQFVGTILAWNQKSSFGGGATNCMMENWNDQT